MKEKLVTVRVRMLGNVQLYENGKEYDVTEDVANQLTGLGQAVTVDSTAAGGEE